MSAMPIHAASAAGAPWEPGLVEVVGGIRWHGCHGIRHRDIGSHELVDVVSNMVRRTVAFRAVSGDLGHRVLTGCLRPPACG